VAGARRELKISMQFTGNRFRKPTLKIAMQRTDFMRGKGYPHIFTSKMSLLCNASRLAEGCATVVD
jgi:hypothetical protein